MLVILFVYSRIITDFLIILTHIHTQKKTFYSFETKLETVKTKQKKRQLTEKSSVLIDLFF